MKITVTLIISLVMICSCGSGRPSSDPQAESGYEIVSSYAHNTSYFTQGLEFAGDTLIEGTGHYGKSKLVKYNIESAAVYNSISLTGEYFGEGITVLNGKIYQLTWTNGKCFIYDLSTLENTGVFSYTGQGWGICNDGTYLIMSNGSSTVYFRDPNDFSVSRTISVRYSDSSSVSNINELEFAEGKIFANIWGEDYIISIDPQTGYVLRKYSMPELRQQAKETFSGSDVLNGIAYRNGNLFVTGKYWPFIFEIKLLD